MKKDVEYYKNLPYTIEITPDDGVFFIKIKELPGCISQGDTIQEALEMIDDAMNCWLEAALEDVDTIPLPESMQEVNYSGKMSLRMPKSLHKKIALEAKEEGVSINSYVVSCLSENNALNEVRRILEYKKDITSDQIKTEVLTDSTQNWISELASEKLVYFKGYGVTNLKNTTNVQMEIN